MSDEIKLKELEARATTLLASKQYEIAIECANEILAIDNKSCVAYLCLGNANMALKDFDAATKAFKLLLLLDADNFDANFGIALVCYYKKDLANAIKKLRKLDIETSPVIVCNLLSRIYIENNQFDEALKYINKAIQKEPLNFEHYSDKIHLLLMQENYGLAINCLDEVKQLIENDINLDLLDIQIALKKGDIKAALEIATKTIEQYPNDVRPYLVLARTQRRMNLKKDALNTLDTAKAIDGISASNKCMLAIEQSSIYASLGDPTQAIAVLESLVNEKIANEQTYYLLLMNYYNQKQYENAIKNAEILLSFKNLQTIQYASTLIYYARSLNKLQRTEEATAVFKDATIKLRSLSIRNPNIYELYSYRAIAHCALKEFDEALDLCNYLELTLGHTSSPYVLRHYILLKSGNIKDAEEYKVKALSMDPRLDFSFIED